MPPRPLGLHDLPAITARYRRRRENSHDPQPQSEDPQPTSISSTNKASPHRPLPNKRQVAPRFDPNQVIPGWEIYRDPSLESVVREDRPQEPGTGGQERSTEVPQPATTTIVNGDNAQRPIWRQLPPPPTITAEGGNPATVRMADRLMRTVEQVYAEERQRGIAVLAGDQSERPPAATHAELTERLQERYRELTLREEAERRSERLSERERRRGESSPSDVHGEAPSQSPAELQSELQGQGHEHEYSYEYGSGHGQPQTPAQQMQTSDYLSLPPQPEQGARTATNTNLYYRSITQFHPTTYHPSIEAVLEPLRTPAPYYVSAQAPPSTHAFKYEYIPAIPPSLPIRPPNPYPKPTSRQRITGPSSAILSYCSPFYPSSTAYFSPHTGLGVGVEVGPSFADRVGRIRENKKARLGESADSGGEGAAWEDGREDELIRLNEMVKQMQMQMQSQRPGESLARGMRYGYLDRDGSWNCGRGDAGDVDWDGTGDGDETDAATLGITAAVVPDAGPAASGGTDIFFPMKVQMQTQTQMRDPILMPQTHIYRPLDVK